jgi:hypothetical protein
MINLVTQRSSQQATQTVSMVIRPSVQPCEPSTLLLKGAFYLDSDMPGNEL